MHLNVVKKLTMLLMIHCDDAHLTYAAEGFKFILQEELSLLLPICISMIPNLRRWQKGLTLLLMIFLVTMHILTYAPE
ncbi:hypothetical protein CEXT_745771 [Caerostris extrusa]|uniref:Uncharacterized protein n=1 Tax=Caerostris extrusa TaxID=172846 RepID=A0AAV4TL56_CAEEX|nr:hypothetical protein CEXT_745771 [Caerostris extrusa]